MAGLAGFVENDMLPAVLLEPVAGGQPGLPAAHNDGCYLFTHHEYAPGLPISIRIRTILY
jgi:hypothetical protein